MTVWYEERTARDPNTGGAAQDGVTLQLFDYTDTAYGTPLVVTDINGLSRDTIVAHGGIFDGFNGPDAGHVRFKAGNGDVGVWEAWAGVRDAAETARDAAQAAQSAAQDAADTVSNSTSILPAGGDVGDVLTRGTDEHTGVWAPPGSGGGVAATWGTLPGKPSTFPPSAHTHPSSQISDATTVGKSLMTASGTDAARTLLKAAPDSTVSFPGFGSDGTHAAPGNHTHTASSLTFVPTGSLTATDLQGAVQQAAAMGGSAGAPDPSFLFVRVYASGAWAVRGIDTGVADWQGPASAGNPPTGGSYAKPGDRRTVTVS